MLAWNKASWAMDGPDGAGTDAVFCIFMKGQRSSRLSYVNSLSE